MNTVDRDTLAFAYSAMPCNPRPFLRSIVNMLLDGRHPTDDLIKRCLWVVISITYGQLVDVDLKVEREHLVPVLQTVHPCLAMIELVNEAGNPVVKRADFRSYLYLLMVQAYGEDVTIKVNDEWDRMYALLTDEERAQLV